MRAKITSSLLTSLFLLIGSAGLGQGFSMQQAYSMFQRQDWNGLGRYAADWTRAQPNDGLAWYCAGEAAYHQNRLNEAIAAYQRATQLMPTHASYYNDLSAAYCKAGNLQMASKAIADGEAAAAGNFSAKDWYVYGNAATQLEEFDHAIKDYRMAVQMNPRFGEAWTNLGWIYEFKGNAQQALLAYNRGAASGNAVGAEDAKYLRLRQAAAANPRLQSGSIPRARLNNVVEREQNAWRQQHSNADQTHNPFGGSQ